MIFHVLVSAWLVKTTTPAGWGIFSGFQKVGRSDEIYK
jgi:hypothetical protein